MHTVVGVNVACVSGGRILVDAVVIVNRSIVDTLAFRADGYITRIVAEAVDAVWNGNGFRCRRSGAGVPNAAAAGSAGRKNGVGHAACFTIEHDVFNNADLFAFGIFNFHADDLARLHITRGAGVGGGALCLSLERSRRKADGGKRCSVDDRFFHKFIKRRNGLCIIQCPYLVRALYAGRMCGT